MQDWVCGALALLIVWLSASGSERFVVVLSSISAGIVVGSIALVEFARGRRSRRAGGPGAYWGGWSGGAFVVIALVGFTHWPLRVSYALSRSAFDDAAHQVAAGERIDVPKRIGLFTIRKAEISDRGGVRIACLWTDLEPSGFTGFVQWPEGHPPFNTWSEVHFNDGWQFISED